MAFNAFIKENPTFVGISEGALRPLINEQDPDIQSKGIQKIRSGVSKGHPMEAENITHIIDELKEGKVKSGRPIRYCTKSVLLKSVHFLPHSTLETAEGCLCQKKHYLIEYM